MGKAVDRLTPEEFHSHRQRFEDVFKSLGVEGQSPLFYRTKDSFGDVDFLINEDTLDGFITREEFLDIMVEQFGLVKKTNESVYKSHQVMYDMDGVDIDFLFSKNYDMDFHMLSYNDLGGFISDLAKRNNLYLKLHKGIFVELGGYGNVSLRDKHYTPLNIKFSDVLAFLGLDYSRWEQGFEDLESIFEFVTSSPQFYSGMFSYKNLNNKRRTRAKKRKTFVEFHKYVKEKFEFTDQPPKCVNFKDFFSEDVISYLDSEVARVVEYENTVGTIREERKEFAQRVMDATGIDGKTLGVIYGTYSLNNLMDFDYVCGKVREWLEKD